MHDKDKTCKDCPDRTIEPNCHEICEGYKKRQKKQQLANKRRREENDYRDYKGGRVRATMKRSKHE